MTELATATVTPVRGRLDRALIEYLRTIPAEDLDDVNIEVVAQAAGVSRATAYRHFGDRDGLLFHAAMELTRRHADIVIDRISALPTVAAKVEEAFAYLAGAIKVDKVLHLLLTSHCSEEITRAIHSISLQVMGPTYQAGQLDGQVRDDLTIDELLSWVSEQRQVMISLRLSEDAARVWARKFVLPALRPQNNSQVSVPELKAVLADLEERVTALDSIVQRTRASLT